MSTRAAPKFHGGNAVWKNVDALTRPGLGTRAAVAYVGDDTGLRLRAGDELICDASPNAVAAGSTNPTALEKLIQKGVKVWSMPGLHAKTIVSGRTLIVGSMNASVSSRENLIEAALEVRDANAVAGALHWIAAIKSHASCVHLDPATIKKLKTIYRKSSAPHSRRPGKAPSTQEKEKVTTWLISQFSDDHNIAHAKEAEKKIRVARRKVEVRSFYHTYYERDPNDSFAKKLRIGDWLHEIEIGSPPNYPKCLWEPGIVWDIVKFPDAWQIHVRWPRGASNRAIPWQKIYRRLAAVGITQANLYRDKSLSNQTARRLEELWIG